MWRYSLPKWLQWWLFFISSHYDSRRDSIVKMPWLIFNYTFSSQRRLQKTYCNLPQKGIEAGEKDRLTNCVTCSSPFEPLESCNALFAHLHSYINCTSVTKKHYLTQRIRRESNTWHRCGNLSFSSASIWDIWTMKHGCGYDSFFTFRDVNAHVHDSNRGF